MTGRDLLVKYPLRPGAMAQLVVDNLAAHFAGRPLLTPVGDPAGAGAPR